MMSALLLFVGLIHISVAFQRKNRIERTPHIRRYSRNYSAPVESFNVLDYGAKGDGTTDNTAAFKAAFAAATADEHEYYHHGSDRTVSPSTSGDPSAYEVTRSCKLTRALHYFSHFKHKIPDTNVNFFFGDTHFEFSPTGFLCIGFW